MSDQSEVWHDVARKSASFRVRSHSGAMSDIFEKQSRRIDDFVRTFKQTEDQLGALFTIGENIAGVDIFDKPSTLRKLLPKLVRSYALDALDDTYHIASESTGKAVDEFLKTLASLETSPSPGVGMGEDHRFKGDAIAGGALVNGGNVIHLCAFPLKPETDEFHETTWPGMTRASYRRRVR